MKQTKHFKRTALPLSAKSMLGTLLLLIAMFLPQGAWAENFISDIMVSTNDKSDPAKNALTNNGYTIVTGDVNNGTGGNWAYLGVKYTTNPAEAITGIMVCKGNSERADKLQEGGGAYVIIEGDSRKWYRAKASGDCNIDNKGVGLTVFYTRDGASTGTPLVTSLNEYSKTDLTGVTYVKYWEGTTNDGTIYKGTIQSDYADCNKGAGSNTPYIYLYYTTHTHSLTDADYDTTNHKYWCASCGYVSAYNAHVWENTGTKVSDATCDKAEVHYQTCKFCKRTGDANHTYFSGSVLGHSYDADGVCTRDANAPHYQPATLTSSYYQIANYGNLCWFRNEANSGKTINAKLTADINLSGKSWATSIGEGKEFAGIFDGQGHTITGNARKALFCVLKAGSTVKNVVSSGATSKDNYENAAYQSPFVRRNYGTIENCIVKSAYWDSNSNYLGGITGVNETGGIVRNCGFYDSTLRLRNGADTQVGGIVGVNCASGRIENCFTWNINYYNIGSLGSGGIVCENRSGAIVSNCYTNDATPVFKQEGTATNLTSGITAAFITTGEMCYKLNAGTTNGSQVWYQKIGTETFPTPVLKNTANTVYQIANFKCDGKTVSTNTFTYSNNASANRAVDGHGLAEYTPTYTWEGTYATPTCTFTLKCNQCNTVVSTQNLTPTKVNANHVDASTCTNGNERWTATGSYSKAGDAAYNGTAQVKDYVIPAVHTFDDVTDPHHTLCTVCKHSFFRYTATTKVEPKANSLQNAQGQNIYDSENHTFAIVDGVGVGVMEFKDPLAIIGEEAFRGRSSFTGSLIIPNSVTSIERSAFNGCTGFTGDLTIPNSVTNIGQYAFNNCMYFKGELTMSNRIARIENSAFTACNRLTGDIKFPKTLTYIGLDAFSNCWTLSSVEMQSVPQMGSNAFFNVDCSKTVVLSDDSNVYKGDNPYFPTVASVTAPCSLDLTDSAVEYHPNLTRTHTFTEESYVDGHCSVCGDDLGPMTVTLGNGEVREYNSLQEAIDYIVNLRMNGATLTLRQDLTLEGYESIEIIFGEVDDDFNFTLDLNGHTITGGCEDNPKYFLITNSKSGLLTLTIANSCQDKKGKLFNCCLDIHENTKVIVREGVSIYPKFENLLFAPSVVNLTSETSSLVNYGDLYGDVNVNRGGASFINNGRVARVNGEFENHGGYCAYFNWADDGSSFSAYVDASIYDYNEEDEEASITSEVTKEPTCSEPGVRTFTGSFIGNLPFGGQEFTDTKEVEIPTLGGHTFAASDLTHDVCTVCNHGFLRYEADSQQTPYTAENLKDEYGNTLTIESHTFSDDHGVMEFNAPLVTIGVTSFARCHIKGITIPNTVTTIGNSAFAYTDLTSINIPNSVKTIDDAAFGNCGALSNVTLGKSIESIGSMAFMQINSNCNITLKSLPQISDIGYPLIFCYLDPEITPIPANFELDDNSFVAPESSLGSSSIANHVTYTRTGIKNQWGTIVVPFSVDCSGDDYDFYTLSSVSGDELTLTKVNGNLNAGTPALIRINSELVNGKTYDLELPAASYEVNTQGTLTGTPAPSTGSGQALTLTGSYKVKEITEEDGYIISNNKFWNIQTIKGSNNVSNNVYCAPFRAYLQGTLAYSPQMLNISWEEATPTVVETLEAITSGEAEIYDLNGRRITELRPGANIVKSANGTTRKVFIK